MKMEINNHEFIAQSAPAWRRGPDNLTDPDIAPNLGW
jgi:hypothetical protein